MAGRIPQAFIDDLLQRTDIAALVGERVQLRRSGAHYKGLCPFHDERTPSFTVSPERQTYHCFGCGAHGTAIGFLMEYDRLAFREAVAELADRCGQQIPEAAAGQRSEAEENAPLYRALAAADRLYRDALRRHPARGTAVEYLRQRGISGEVAARFGIGFAPPGWDNLLRQLDDVRAGVRAGLIIERDGKTYDRFRDRITFPIHDRRGRVVAFGARVVNDGEPKYLNSPETPVFQKGREVYGLYHALQAQRRPQRLILVEGYMDVLALTQAGVEGAVATLGTATTREQAGLLLRTAPGLVLCFDGDDAGREAAYRAVENLLPVLQGDREVRVLLLPEGDDPDDLVRREGREAFEERLDTAAPVAEFFLGHLAADCDLATVDGRARLLERAAPPLHRVPAGLLRETLISGLAERSHTEAERIDRLLQGAEAQPAQQGAQAERRRPASRSGETLQQAGTRRTAVRHAIALLLQQPSLAARAGEPDRFADRELPGCELLQQLLEIARSEPHISTAQILERFRETRYEAPLNRLAAWQHPEAGETNLEPVFRDALTRIEEQIVATEQDQLIRALEEGGEAGSAPVQERLRAAQRLQFLMDRLKRYGLGAEEGEELRQLRAQFRL